MLRNTVKKDYVALLCCNPEIVAKKNSDRSCGEQKCMQTAV